jgi:hypothetical protein
MVKLKRKTYQKKKQKVKRKISHAFFFSLGHRLTQN